MEAGLLEYQRQRNEKRKRESEREKPTQPNLNK